MICVPMIHVAGKFTLSLAYSADGKYLASGAIDGIIAVFDMEQRKLLHTLEVNINTILYCSLTFRMNYLFRIYLKNLIQGHAMPIRSLAFSPDSQRLLTGSDDGSIKM